MCNEIRIEIEDDKYASASNTDKSVQKNNQIVQNNNLLLVEFVMIINILIFDK